ncbi:MAG: AAA family ATPase [Candidatus Parabeggiatoa sp.]|nr:AAA family ATPase [Candidatus Parabeggiatoa sp.]
MEAILFTGIQATGKSTFYKHYFSDTHIRINLDMLKTRHREDILLKACLQAKQSFVVDNTNPSVETRQKYIELAKTAGFEIIGYYFQSKIKAAIERNKTRTGKACIPEKGIQAAYAKLKIPHFSEGFDTLYYVKMGHNNEFIIQKWIKNEI